MPDPQLGQFFAEGAAYSTPTSDQVGKRTFLVDTRGPEGRVIAPAAARRYAPTHDDHPKGWTVQTPYGKPPEQPADYLACVLCGARDSVLDPHPCAIEDTVSLLSAR